MIPDTALLALSADATEGKALPPLGEALSWAELVHATLVKLSDHGDEEGPSSCLTGRDEFGQPLEGHAHAMVMPVSLEVEGHLDHVVVVAGMGFDGRAREALMGVRRVYGRDVGGVSVSLVGLGRREDFRHRLGVLGEGRVWVSKSPYVAPLFLKERGRASLVAQVQGDLCSRGFPKAVKVEVEVSGGGYVDGGDFWGVWRGRAVSTRWRGFRLERGDAGKKPAVGWGFGLRLCFDEVVQGPIALGYASHFGLGVMVPAAGG